MDRDIKAIETLAKRKIKHGKTVLETLILNKEILKTPDKPFDPENPLHRIEGESVVSHKAFMDYAMFGGDNFQLWARFRFPESKNKKLINRTGIDEQLNSPHIIERMGKGSDWIHLTSYQTCLSWCKKFLWRARVTRWSDICMSKVIQEKQNFDVDQKVAMQKKMYEDLMQGVLAATREATRRLVEDMKNDPNLKLSVKDLVSLGRFAVQENKIINPPDEKPEKNAKTLVQNNYHFNDVAKLVHADIKDI